MSELPFDRRERIDPATWDRIATYNFFKDFTEPYHGVTVRVDCTGTYRFAKARGISVFFSLLHRTLKAASRVENFCTRIEDDTVWRYHVLHGGAVVPRPNGTFGFGYFPYQESTESFVRSAMERAEAVKVRTDLERSKAPNLIRFSALPWTDFTSLSHARNFAFKDSAPQVTFGKFSEVDGRKWMPVSIHVHHALVDGLHVGQFLQIFEEMLANPEG